MPLPPPPAPPPPPAAPPPPPPVPPSPPQSSSLGSQARPGLARVQQPAQGSRSALLVDIQRGAKLKKVAVINDRSAPAIDKPKAGRSDAVGSSGGLDGASGGPTTSGPQLGGLFAGGFPVLRPAGHRDTAGSRAGLALGVRQPMWTPPVCDCRQGDAPDSPPPSKLPERGSAVHSTAPAPAPAPAPPSASSKPSLPLHERPIRMSAFLPCPPPAPPPAPPLPPMKPTWLPVQPHSLPQPSTPPPPPPPPIAAATPDRSSGFFFPPPPPPHTSQSDSKFGNFRDSHLFPPPPPPPPSLPPNYPLAPPPTPPPLPTQPPLPKVPPVPSPTLRPGVPPQPSSHPIAVPTRRPPAVPRPPGGGRLAPPPAPPTRSPNTELSSRIAPPVPPPPPPSIMRNGHLHSLDDFESKFRFHPVDDFPPPDEFRPIPRIYPSKEAKENPRPPALRTHMR